MDGVDRIREVLSSDIIVLNKLEDDTGIFDQVDAFINLSRGNDSVEQVILSPSTDPGEGASGISRYAIWDKIAEGIGNLQALCEITIGDSRFGDAEEEQAPVPDWEILACILRRLRRKIQLCMHDNDALLWNTEALPVFAGAIHGQAMITGFSTGDGFPFHCLDLLCSALLTLPALENVSFEHIAEQGPEEGQSLESMIKLLKSPSLREVTFVSVDFTNNLFQAVAAKVLKERSQITDLSFSGCSFPEGGSAVIARALKTNTTLKCLDFDDGGDWANGSWVDDGFYEALAVALLSNSTLQRLNCSAPDGSGSCSWFSPLFLALQVNHGLKVLTIDQFNLIDEELSAAVRLGLDKNSTLEVLNLSNIELGDNGTRLWREAFAFLRTNTALKTLYMHFDYYVSESHAAAIQMEVLTMLRENESLETLCMTSKDTRRFEDYPGYVAAIQPNTTLKSLLLYSSYNMDEDETKALFLVLKKNYGLEEISGFPHGLGDIRSIFDLNRAGRRYLVQDGSSISKGVDVLSGVSDDINSVFLHLLENPRLCDRSAVEMSSTGNIDNARSTSPGNHCGRKREQQALSHTGKQPRMQLE
jgi:hypothetical protein